MFGKCDNIATATGHQYMKLSALINTYVIPAFPHTGGNKLRQNMSSFVTSYIQGFIKDASSLLYGYFDDVSGKSENHTLDNYTLSQLLCPFVTL